MFGLEHVSGMKIIILQGLRLKSGRKKIHPLRTGFGYLKNILPMFIGMRKKERKQNVPYLASW